jgi:hypothetical protein
MKSPEDCKLDPAIRLQEGRMIRTVADAIALLREHETRPGVDDRDEVLHKLERAENDEEQAEAVKRFRSWLLTWGLVLPVTMKPGSTQGRVA